MMMFREVKNPNKMNRIQRDPYREKEGNWWIVMFAIGAIVAFFAFVPIAIERDLATSNAEACGSSTYACTTHRCLELADLGGSPNCTTQEGEESVREYCRQKNMAMYNVESGECLTWIEAEYEREK
jgi:hypothetical protein